MSGHSHKPDENKPDPGQEKILSTLGHLRAHLEDTTPHHADIDQVTKLIRARTREVVTGHPIGETDRHYDALDKQLSEAEKVLRQKLTAAENAVLAPGVTITEFHKSRIADAKKKVQEAADARKLAAELHIKNPEKIKEHGKHHEHELEQQRDERNAKLADKFLKGKGGAFYNPLFWTQKLFYGRLWRNVILGKEAYRDRPNGYNPLTWPSRIIQNTVLNNMILGKGATWNPLTWPSKSVQYAYTSVAEHKLAAIAGAGVGTVIAGFPLGTAVGTGVSVAAVKLFNNLKKGGSSGSQGGHGAHGADSHGADHH